MNLLGAFKVSLGELEVLAHHAEFNPVSTENMANLAEHLLDPYVGAHVARAVVAGEQKFQLFACPPRWVPAQHPSGFRPLDVRAHPGLKNEVHHAAVPPRAAGQGS